MSLCRSIIEKMRLLQTDRQTRKSHEIGQNCVCKNVPSHCSWWRIKLPDSSRDNLLFWLASEDLALLGGTVGK